MPIVVPHYACYHRAIIGVTTLVPVLVMFAYWLGPLILKMMTARVM